MCSSSERFPRSGRFLLSKPEGVRGLRRCVRKISVFSKQTNSRKGHEFGSRHIQACSSWEVKAVTKPRGHLPLPRASVSCPPLHAHTCIHTRAHTHTRTHTNTSGVCSQGKHTLKENEASRTDGQWTSRASCEQAGARDGAK